MGKQSKPSYRIGLYIRVSTEEQAVNPEGSLKSQEARLRQAVRLKNAEGHFGEIVDIFVDSGKSGKDTNRPALQRMLTAIRNREINLVMASELSRISRSIKDFAEIWEMMQEHECDFQSLRENFDTTTAAGEMVLYSMANIAQFERRQISERVSANFISRASRGLRNGGCVPYGYKMSKDKPGHLDIDEDAAPTVKRIFSEFLKRGTLSETAKRLNSEGIRLKRKAEGGGTVRAGHLMLETIHHILRNKTYIAIRTYKVKGKVIEVPAVWKPIVDRVTFKRVQEVLSKNSRGKKKPFSENRYPYLLSGILFCKDCGGRLGGMSANGNGGKIAYYGHTWKAKREVTLSKKSKCCDPKRILAKKIEPVIWKEVEAFLAEPKTAQELFNGARRLRDGAKGKSEKQKLKAKQDTIARQLEALAERLSELPKSVPAGPIYKQMERLEEQRSDLERQVGELKTTESDDVPVQPETFDAFCQQLKKLKDTLSPEIKSQIIQKFVSRIEVRPDGVEVTFHAGQSHYLRELALAGSRSFFVPKSSRPVVDFRNLREKGKNHPQIGSTNLTNGRG